MSYFELAYESRRFTQTRDETTQTFEYYICDPPLISDQEAWDGTYGVFFTPNDDVAILQFIYDNFPDSRTFLTSLGPVELYINELSGAEQVDGGWKVTITYSLPEKEQNSSHVQFGFSTNGDTSHISRAISQRSIVAASGSSLIPPITYGLIGVGKETIEGIDISDAGLAFSITGYFDPSVWSTSVMLTYASLSKTYNNATFYGFPAGSVLFDYCDANSEAFKFVPVTFNFIYKPNISAVADPPFAALTMLGHDIVDYLYDNQTSNSAQILLPRYRQVLQVRYPGNFDLLGV